MEPSATAAAASSLAASTVGASMPALPPVGCGGGGGVGCVKRNVPWANCPHHCINCGERVHGQECGYCKRTIGPIFIKCFGSERTDGKTSICSDNFLTTFSIGLSAAIGNTVASFSRVPYEVVKQALQTGQYSSTMEALSTMWKTSGMRSFFPLGSVSIQMVRDILYAIFTLLSYEYIKENWVLKMSEDDPNNRWWRDMIAGATAGGIGSYLTNPFDVIKTRLQTTDVTGLYGGSITKCALSVLEEGGPAAFLRGSVPRLMHKVPANGFFFVFYEFFRRVLQVE
jgi:hypothetical protein